MFKKVLAIFQVVVVAVVAGALIGLSAFVFMWLIKQGQLLLWETVQFPLQPLVICTVAGLLIGVMQSRMSERPHLLQQQVEIWRRSGRLEYAGIGGRVISALVSLIAGASLGPEAALMDLAGGLSTWTGEQMARLRVRVGLEPEPRDSFVASWLQRWPSIIGIVVGLTVFFQLLQRLIGGGFLTVDGQVESAELLWTIPVALVGFALGSGYLALQNRLWRGLGPLENRPILRSTLAGLVLGLTSLAVPFVLFSGQYQMRALYADGAQLGAGVLLTIGAARLLLTPLLLASDWRGGQFMPVLFAGEAFGLAIHQLVPTIPLPVAVAATITAMMAGIVPRPIFALPLVGSILAFSQGAVITIATLLIVVIQMARGKTRLPGR